MRAARIEPGWWARLVAAINPYSLDSRLLAGDSPADSPELAARYQRLVDPRHLRQLADQARASRGGGLDSRPLQPSLAPGTAAAWRDPQEPVAAAGPLPRFAEESQLQPRGLILAERLLSDGTSPLYAGELMFGEDERPSVEIAARRLARLSDRLDAVMEECGTAGA